MVVIAIEIAGRRASDEYRFWKGRWEVEEFLKIKFLTGIGFLLSFLFSFFSFLRIKSHRGACSLHIKTILTDELYIYIYVVL